VVFVQLGSVLIVKVVMLADLEQLGSHMAVVAVVKNRHWKRALLTFTYDGD